MEFITALLLGGIARGAIYAIVALGFVLVFKATSVVNFAHGSFLMVGAYLAVTLFTTLGLPFWVGLIIVVVGMAVLGAGVYFGIMRWMIGKSFLAVVLVTVGLEIAIRAMILLIYGPREFGRVTALPTGQFEVSGIVVPYVNVLVTLIAGAAVVVFFWIFTHTQLGLHMRAVGDRVEAAQIAGVDIHRIYALAWALGFALAGVGGLLYAHIAGSVDLSVPAIGLRAFPAAILGGLDSVRGAVVGGLIVGIVESIGAGYLGSEWRDPVAFGIMFLVLFWRPWGIFGTKEIVRV